SVSEASRKSVSGLLRDRAPNPASFAREVLFLSEALAMAGIWAESARMGRPDRRATAPSAPSADRRLSGACAKNLAAMRTHHFDTRPQTLVLRKRCAARRDSAHAC